MQTVKTVSPSGSKDRILAAAEELFYRNGYLATSVDDIVDRAGVSKSNFYYHYKSKEDLGVAVISARTAEFRRDLVDTLADVSLTPLERLDKLFVNMVDRQRASLHNCGCPFGNMVAEMSEHSERLREQLSNMFRTVTDHVAEIVAIGQSRGEIRTDAPPRELAALLVQTSQGMHLMSKCHKTVDTVSHTGRLLIRLLAVSDKSQSPSATV